MAIAPGITGMWVRLIRKLADQVDGIDLRERKVGDVFDLRSTDASLLVAEGWAIPARRAADFLVRFRQPVTAKPSGGRAMIPNVGSVAPDHPCPQCGSNQVKVALATGAVIYYRCLACQGAWSETDRRQSPRMDTSERRKAS
jgi:hypothetical protein